MAIRRKISLIIAFLTIFLAFSYGQSPLGAVCAESRHLYGVSGMPGSMFSWFINEGEGIVVQGDGTDTALIQWGYKTGDFEIEVIESSSAGCIGVPVYATGTIQAPEVELGYDFYEQCEGDSLILDAVGSYFGDATYLWHDGSTRSFFIASASDNIWVLVTDGLGCTRYDSIEYVLHQLPDVNLGNDTLLCDVDNPLQLDAGNFSQYEWVTTIGDNIGNPIYVEPIYDNVDSILVTVTDFNGCQNSDTMLVYPCSQALFFKDLINTFTPDGDGVNEKWEVLKEDRMAQFPDAVLEIFDRWGRMVFRTEDVFGEPWDGTSNGREMPMGAYYFVLDLKFGGFEAVTGSVNIVR